MWQRFSERARRVILLGQEEAEKLNSAHVGTEHLLLGLARETDGCGAKVLAQIGIEPEQLRAATLAAIAPVVEPQRQASEPKLTGKAKRALELAADEARRLRHNHIGTEHLLLALLREKDGVACEVLNGLGLTLENTRAQVLIHLDEVRAPIAATAPASSRPDDTVARSRVSPAVRELLTFAAQNSREVGASQVELVHLLRAICREKSEGHQILRDAGVDVEALRQRLNKWKPFQTE